MWVSPSVHCSSCTRAFLFKRAFQPAAVDPPASACVASFSQAGQSVCLHPSLLHMLAGLTVSDTTVSTAALGHAMSHPSITDDVSDIIITTVIIIIIIVIIAIIITITVIVIVIIIIIIIGAFNYLLLLT